MNPIPTFDGYLASEEGEVFSDRSGELRKLSRRNNKGYLVVNFTVGSGAEKYRHRMPVHRAVAMAFHGVPPIDKPLCCHRNGDSLDNRPGNLYWGNHRDNLKDARGHGTYGAGELAPNCRLSDVDIAELRLMRSGGEKIGMIANQFGVSVGYVYQICAGDVRQGGTLKV